MTGKQVYREMMQLEEDLCRMIDKMDKMTDRFENNCQKCEMAQHQTLLFLYRWKNANIEMKGCAQHIKQIFDILNKAQESDEGFDLKEAPFSCNLLSDEFMRTND